MGGSATILAILVTAFIVLALEWVIISLLLWATTHKDLPKQKWTSWFKP